MKKQLEEIGKLINTTERKVDNIEEDIFGFIERSKLELSEVADETMLEIRDELERLEKVSHSLKGGFVNNYNDTTNFLSNKFTQFKEDLKTKFAEESFESSAWLEKFKMELGLLEMRLYLMKMEASSKNSEFKKDWVSVKSIFNRELERMKQLAVGQKEKAKEFYSMLDDTFDNVIRKSEEMFS